MKYMLLIAGDPEKFATLSADEQAGWMGEYFAFTAALQESGEMVAGDPLHGVETAISVSVDGGKAWGKLSALQVADGKGGLRAALNSDVTHIRWVLPVLNPGVSGTLTYNAIVR